MAVLLDDPPTVDFDDVFGVRRALEGLPTRCHDRFADDWAALTDLHAGLEATYAAVRREAKHRALLYGGDDPLAQAWWLVNDATSRYLAWWFTHLGHRSTSV